MLANKLHEEHRWHELYCDLKSVFFNHSELFVQNSTGYKFTSGTLAGIHVIVADRFSAP